MLLPIGDINPRRTFPVFNYLLLGANIAAWVFFGSLPYYEQVVADHGLTPKIWSLADGFTCMFLHADIFHLFGNMLILWIVGDNVEDRFGHGGYLFFYLAAGAFASLVQVILTPAEQAGIPIIGASGAVAGVMGAYLILFPFSRIRMLLWFFLIVHVFTVPSWVIIVMWIAMEALGAVQQVQGHYTGVAVFAHLGGVAFGVFCGLLWRLFGHSPRHD